MQLTFDLFETVIAPPDVQVTCGYCGETSPNRYVHDINHSWMPQYGMCCKAWMFTNHVVSCERAIESGADRSNCYWENCPDHRWGEFVKRLPVVCVRGELETKRAWLERVGSA